MKSLRLLLAAVAAAVGASVATAENALDLDALFDSIAAPRSYAARVEAPEGSGFVLTLPSGQFLDERTIKDPMEGPQTYFKAFGAGDTLYNYSRGVLRVAREISRPSGSSAMRLPAQIVETLRSQLENSPRRYRVESFDDSTIVVASTAGEAVVGRTILSFDPRTYALRSLRQNVGSEVAPRNQIVLGDYFPVRDFDFPESGITSEWLRARYPDAFVERMPHTHLKKVHTAGRIDLHDEAGDALVVILEATDPATPARIEAVRDMAGGRHVFWAFLDTKVEDILEILPKASPGETALSNAMGLKMPAPMMLTVSEGGVIVDKRKL